MKYIYLNQKKNIIHYKMNMKIWKKIKKIYNYKIKEIKIIKN
jgi:hypothetical protein